MVTQSIKETLMFAKKIAIAAVAGTALLASSGAFADHRWDGRQGYQGHRHYGHDYRYAPRVVVRPAPRYYYTPPAPVYYAPEPYYYEPRPVIYGRIPLGDARIGFRIGL